MRRKERNKKQLRIFVPHSRASCAESRCAHEFTTLLLLPLLHPPHTFHSPHKSSPNTEADIEQYLIRRREGHDQFIVSNRGVHTCAHHLTRPCEGGRGLSGRACRERDIACAILTYRRLQNTQRDQGDSPETKNNRSGETSKIYLQVTLCANAQEKNSKRKHYLRPHIHSILRPG